MDTPPNMNQTPPTPEPSPKQNNVGPIIGIIIIIIVLLLGGLYFWGQRVDDASEDELPETSDSDTVVDIEADLEEDFDDLDAELESFEAETEGEF